MTPKQEKIDQAEAIPHACEICGYSGADHQKPNGDWIHLFCGQKVWAQEVAKVNRGVA